MSRIIFLLSMLCFAFQSYAQSAPRKATTMELDADNAQAVYMGSYTMEFGNWTLYLADGEQIVAKIDIFANSAKRLARTYTTDDMTLTGGAVYLDEVEHILGDGSFTLSYVSKGKNYPVYHIEGALQDTYGNSFTLNSDIELLAYDYLFYSYYEMGLMPFESCIVQLQDAPDEDTGVVVEMDFVGGNWEYIDYMGILKVTAETADGRYTQLLFDAEEVMESGSYVINDLYASYCYIANLETQAYEAYVKSGTAEITVSPVTESGQTTLLLSLTAKIRTKNDAIYILRIPAIVPVGKDFHDYTGISAPTLTPSLWQLPSKTLRDGRIIIERAGHRFGTNGVRVR